VPELIRQWSQAAAEKKELESKFKEPSIDRLAKERDRVSSLTDGEWRAS